MSKAIFLYSQLVKWENDRGEGETQSERWLPAWESEKWTESQRQREIAIQTLERETNLKKQRERWRKEWKKETEVESKLRWRQTTITTGPHHQLKQARYRSLNVCGALSAPTWWTAAQLIYLPSQWWQISTFFPLFRGVGERESMGGPERVENYRKEINLLFQVPVCSLTKNILNSEDSLIGRITELLYRM